MNAIVFGAKRVFHGVLKMTRKRLQAVSPGMTAARLDMMYLLAGGCEGRRKPESFCAEKTLQCVLRHELGVSATVVARMLRSLERLGWVTRYRWERDLRQRVVALTPEGLECLRRAFKQVVPFARRLVYRAVCFGKRRPSSARWRAIERLNAYLRSLREHCRAPPTRLWSSWRGTRD
jgi:DNA-binding MarR family transcriptional regulator